jgi:PIN domain nuclease of toxin-antitoxin system
MSLLLDTHVFLWWLVDDPQLSREARATIADSSVMAFVSAASLWEAEIKTALGRLELDIDVIDLAAEVTGNGFVELPITGRYTRTAATLPPHHNDPFDRMLIAQVIVDDLRMVTTDQIIGRYGIDVLST